MLNVELTNLRKDFDFAITSNRNVVTLDPSIADLRAKISQTDFVEILLDLLKKSAAQNE